MDNEIYVYVFILYLFKVKQVLNYTKYFFFIMLSEEGFIFVCINKYKM